MATRNQIDYLNTNELIESLKKNGYSHIVPIIRDNGLNGKSLLELSEFTLRRFCDTRQIAHDMWAMIRDMKHEPEKFLPRRTNIARTPSINFGNKPTALKLKLEQIITNTPVNKVLPRPEPNFIPQRPQLPPKTVTDGYIRMDQNHSLSPPIRSTSDVKQKKLPPLPVEDNVEEYDEGEYLKPNDIEENEYEPEPLPSRPVAERKPIAPPRSEDNQPPLPQRISSQLNRNKTASQPNRSKYHSRSKSESKDRGFRNKESLPRNNSSASSLTKKKRTISNSSEDENNCKKLSEKSDSKEDSNKIKIEVSKDGSLPKQKKNFLDIFKKKTSEPVKSNEYPYENMEIKSSGAKKENSSNGKERAQRPLPPIPVTPEAKKKLEHPIYPPMLSDDNNEDYISLVNDPGSQKRFMPITNISKSTELLYENSNNESDETLPEYVNNQPIPPSIQTQILPQRILPQRILPQDKKPAPFIQELALRNPFHQQPNFQNELSQKLSPPSEKSNQMQNNFVPSSDVYENSLPEYQDISNDDEDTNQPDYVNTFQNIKLQPQVRRFPGINTVKKNVNVLPQIPLRFNGANTNTQRPLPTTLQKNNNGSSTEQASVLPKPPSMDYIPNLNPSMLESDEEEIYENALFNVNDEPFYRNTDRKGAKELLRGLENGAFLFRPSNNYFLTLTIKNEDKFYNIGIEKTNLNRIKCSSLGSSVCPEFNSISAFINHFTKEDITLLNQNVVVCIKLKPVLPANVF